VRNPTRLLELATLHRSLARNKGTTVSIGGATAPDLVMKIIIAQTAGFCMGVKRAVDMAIDVSSRKGSSLYTLGKLIHNQQTIEMLRTRGVKQLKDEIPEQPSTVLIRAHGVPPATETKYRSTGHRILDGTCPKVKTVHKVIEKFRTQGYAIIIAGDAGHAEVIGLQGYAGDAGHLIHTPEDVDALPELPRICFVSQTTFDRSTFDAMAVRIQQRFRSFEVVIKKTICSATDKRQQETEELARSVDAMIVVGGKDSANTLRLANISAASGAPTQHVETEKEIDLAALEECATVGITAGASTPHWMIKRVVDYVQLNAQRRRRTPGALAWQALDVLANLNIFVSLGAAAMFYVSCVLQGIHLDSARMTQGVWISLLYFLSMYLWNSLGSIEATKHLGLSRYEFYLKYRHWLLGLAGASIIAIVVTSYLSSPALFWMMLFLVCAGTLYHATIVPGFLLPILRYRSIKDVPTSRDLFVALAWGVLITFAPQALVGTFVLGDSAALVFLWVFMLSYLRSLIFDLRDIEADRIMGRETLVTIIGEDRVRRGIKVAVGVAAVVVLSVWIGGHTHLMRFLSNNHSVWLPQLPVLVYLFAFVLRSRQSHIQRSSLFSILADGQFYLSALCAVAARVFLG